MDINEILETENDIEEAFIEVGSQAIFLEKLITKKAEGDDLYGEVEDFTYTEKTQLIGVANINPLQDDISEIGKKLECTIVLTVGSKSLKENSLYVNGSLDIKTNQDNFVYLGKRYQIRNITYSGILNDYVLIFNFECTYLGDVSNGE